MQTLDNKNLYDLILVEAIEFKQAKRFSDKSLVYFRSFLESIKMKRFVDITKWLIEDRSIKMEAMSIMNEVFPEWSSLNDGLKQ